jgi:ABC-type branched-subunit amino acid transport system ATPase component
VVHDVIGRRRAQLGASEPAAPAVPGADLARHEPDLPQEAPEAGGGGVLSIRNLGVRYGGVVAVDGVTFDVPAGAIVGLIGPNGAGKTTLLDAASGFAPASGEILLDGQPVGALKPHRRVRAGLGRTFQSIDLYDDLSVSENVAVGLTGARGRIDGDPEDHLAATLDALGLAALAERPAGELSQGTRQLVSISRALVGRPSVLLLDEPAAGLDSTESRWLGERLRDIRRGGTTILLVDHDVQLVLDLCDEIHVLDFGSVIASGPPSAVRDDPRVAAAYLGGGRADAEPAPAEVSR